MIKFIDSFFLFFIFSILSFCNSAGGTNHTYTVYFFVSSECPMCRNYLPVWKNIIGTYQSDRIKFKLVHCNVSDTLGWNDMKNTLKIPSIENTDSETIFSQRWGIETVPSVLVTNNNNNVVYLGATDNRVVETGSYKPKATAFYLKEVLDKLNAGTIPQYKNIPAKGCYIED